MGKKMNKLDLNIFEITTLIDFLEKYITKNSLSEYEDYFIQNLFLAYLKLKKSKDQWDKSMLYTE